MKTTISNVKNVMDQSAYAMNVVRNLEAQYQSLAGLIVCTVKQKKAVAVITNIFARKDAL